MTLINVKFSFCFIEENFTVYRDRVTLGTFLTFSTYPLISFYRIRKKRYHSSSSSSGVADAVDSSLDNQLGQCSIEIPWFRTRSNSFCQKNHYLAFKRHNIKGIIFLKNNALIHDQQMRNFQRRNKKLLFSKKAVKIKIIRRFHRRECNPRRENCVTHDNGWSH